MSAFGRGHHLHLIDGSAFIFRAYHALPPLTRKSDGAPVGAVAGFCNMLQRYVEGNTGPDAATHLAVVFDRGSKTFRNEIYPDYKGHRPEMPEDLSPQIPMTREAVRAFGIACEEMEGFEADDIIATLACRARDAGGRVTIVSSDKDLMQLVGGGVEMLDAMKNVRIDVEGVEAKFGVPPEKVVDVQALAGDPTDNVPGAPGIGIKTAALLIREFGDVETLLARVDEIKQPKRRQALEQNAEQIRISKRLVELDCGMELAFTLDDLALREPDPEAVLGFLTRMEFRTLTRRVAAALGRDAPPLMEAEPTPDAAAPVPFDLAAYEVVRDADALRAWVEAIHETGVVAVDTETTSLDEMRAELVGVSLAVAPGRACYVPLAHRARTGKQETQDDGLFRDEGGEPAEDGLAEGQIPMREALAILGPMLADPAVLKVFQNAKYDVKVLARMGVPVHPVADTMLMSYAMHGGLHPHGMDTLSERYLGHTPVPIKSLIGTGKSMITFDRVPVADAAPYAAEDADVTLRLHRTFAPQLHLSRVTTVYETLERPMIPVLARMEMAGVEVDRDTLSRMSGAFAQTMAGLEADIHALAGRPFNVGSPKQLGEVLFDEMGLPGGKRGRNGAWSTPADVLEDLATEHDLARRVLDWRQVSKLKTTYTDNLQEHIHPETGRVHTSFSIAGANTGRLASSDPNLQNIPIRSEEGRRIRTAFVAPEGRVLVALDYSQIELRILAHVAGIEAFRESFRRGEDIHARTASEMFGAPQEGLDPDVRRTAKMVNFGVIYGISARSAWRGTRGCPGTGRRSSSTATSSASPAFGTTWPRRSPSRASTATCRRCSADAFTRPRSAPPAPRAAIPAARRRTPRSRAPPPTSSAAP